MGFQPWSGQKLVFVALPRRAQKSGVGAKTEYLHLLIISDELKKKISESYSIFRSRVIEDLRPRDSEWSEIQQSCV